LSEEESNEIRVQVESDDQLNDAQVKEQEDKSENLAIQTEPSDEQETSLKELKKQLSKEKEKSSQFEFQLKHTLADFQNLERKTKFEIENGVNTKIDKFMIEFLQIYDDFIRAQEAFSKNNVNTEGLDSILKNMDSFLAKHNVSPIDAIGEIFDPKLHEAISIIKDPTLDENTITKELRKGYISHNRVIRPTLVEISKKSKSESLGD